MPFDTPLALPNPAAREVPAGPIPDEPAGAASPDCPGERRRAYDAGRALCEVWHSYASPVLYARVRGVLAGLGPAPHLAAVGLYLRSVVAGMCAVDGPGGIAREPIDEPFARGWLDRLREVEAEPREAG